MRIAIVHDSAPVRDLLRQVVEGHSQLSVAWVAANGPEALERLRGDKPDLALVALDMRPWDGNQTTKRIMDSDRSCSILLVAADTNRQIDRIYTAMGHGALDVANAPTLDKEGRIVGQDQLLKKIALIGRVLGLPVRVGETPLPNIPPLSDTPMLVVVGASTGGPEALAEVMGRMHVDSSIAVIIVLHIDFDFAPQFVATLGSKCHVPSRLILDGDKPTGGAILVAGTNDHLLMRSNRSLGYTPEPREAVYRPSVDVFFGSVAKHWPAHGIGVLLTGMGNDGAQGLLTLRRKGWHTIAQDKESSKIWGMPGAAVEAQAAVEVLPVQEIGAAINKRLCR